MSQWQNNLAAWRISSTQWVVVVGGAKSIRFDDVTITTANGESAVAPRSGLGRIGKRKALYFKQLITGLWTNTALGLKRQLLEIQHSIFQIWGIRAG